MRRREPPPAPTPRTEDDDWADHVRGECAKALVDWLKGLNTQRAICTLNRHELESMCEAVTAAWIGVQGERVVREPDSETARKYKALLLGG